VKSFGTLNVPRSASHSFSRRRPSLFTSFTVCTDHFFSCLRSRRPGQYAYDMRSCGTTAEQRLSMWDTSSFPRNVVALQLPGDFSRRREKRYRPSCRRHLNRVTNEADKRSLSSRRPVASLHGASHLAINYDPMATRTASINAILRYFV